MPAAGAWGSPLPPSPPPDPPSAKPSLQPAKSSSFKELSHGPVERWHCPVLMLLTALVALVVRAALYRDQVPMGRRIELQLLPHTALAAQAGSAALHGAQPAPGQRARTAQQTSNLQEQLAGCRTAKTDPIPGIPDKSGSLRALDAHTPEQRRVAQRYTDALSACTDFVCLQRANALERAPGQFHFPHFLVIGFPKCATTSLYCHLIQHPQVQHPQLKEPHLLTDQCWPALSNCSTSSQRQFVADILNLREAAEASFTRAAFEGSTHYVQEADWLAAQLAEAFPWLKLVISMRDPISQAIAMHLHNVAHGRPANCTQDLAEKSIYHCVRKGLKSRARYGAKLQKWVEAFPKEQLHFVQYERVIDEGAMPAALQSLKSFLDLDPHLPSDMLPLTNFKHQRGIGDALGKSWDMQRYEYEHLVGMARSDTAEVLDLMVRHGFTSSAEVDTWRSRWERTWQDNLSSCGQGSSSWCKVVVS